jgi:hypothetical protein
MALIAAALRPAVETVAAPAIGWSTANPQTSCPIRLS